MLLKVNDNGTLRQFDIAQMSDVSAKMPNVTFGNKTTLVDTTTLSFSKDGDNDWYCTAENPIQGFTKTDFLYDAVYKITWDGVEYDELFVQEHEMAQISTNTQRVTGWYDWRCIGNASILGYHNYYETNAPFCVAYDFHRNEAEIQIFTLSTEASHTIKIERIPYTKKLTPIQYYTDTIRGRSPIAWGSGEYAVVEGEGSIASGASSHSEGCTSIARGNYSHSEGEGTITDGRASHAEGYYTEAKGIASHAEGQFNIASGSYGAHAEGYQTEAKGTVSHSEGLLTLAKGFISHTEGYQTVANNKSQHVFGEYNIIDTTQDTTVRGAYVEIVGNGTDNARSNAYTLDWSGNGRYAGNVYVGCNSDSSGGTRLPHDIQVNGTSVVSNGVANIPIASADSFGAVKTSSQYGIGVHPTHNVLYIIRAESSQIKAASTGTLALTPFTQHESTFYGLAKAAGDSTQSASSNAVGTYTSEAKAAIKTMIGVPTMAEIITAVHASYAPAEEVSF